MLGLLRVSVAYILDYYAVKSTFIREGVVDKKIAIRLAKGDIILLYKGLAPWINLLKERAYWRNYFKDFDWLYEECEKECRERR